MSKLLTLVKRVAYLLKFISELMVASSLFLANHITLTATPDQL